MTLSPLTTLRSELFNDVGVLVRKPPGMNQKIPLALEGRFLSFGAGGN